MTRTLNTVSENKVAVWAITPNGAALATRIAAAFPAADVYAMDTLAGLPISAVRMRSLAEAVAAHFRRYGGHVFIMATGIVVRAVAGLIVHKTEDPAVVVVDDRGTFAISLLSGHLGGANRLAGRVAAAIGAQPVITTATDVNAVPAVDVLAAELGLEIENPQAIKSVNRALLTGSPVEVHDPWGILAGRIPNAAAFSGSRGAVPARVYADDRLAPAPAGALVLRPLSLVAGIGCNRNTRPEEMKDLLLDTLHAAGLARASLRSLASIDLKADEPGLAALAKELKLPLEFFAREQIGRVQDAVPSPSDAVAKHIGVKSVCEAAAMLASRGGTLIVPKRSSRNATVAIARISFTS
jgi:cobalt-precorrin 5A hydrolase